MPKSDTLPTDPRFPAFRAKLEADYGGRLADEVLFAGVQMPQEPYHTEPARAFRMFIAGWDAALSSTLSAGQPSAEGVSTAALATDAPILPAPPTTTGEEG